MKTTNSNILHCTICEGENLITIGNIYYTSPAYNTHSTLIQCNNCGKGWIHPYPDESKIGNIYGEAYHYNINKLRDYLYSLYLQKHLKKDYELVTKFKKRGKVLDIGAGRGDLLKLFDSSNWQKWAFDPYLSQLDVKKLKEKIGSHVNDFDSLKEYPENEFDVVVLRNVIEHTNSYKSFLVIANKLLKPKGVLFIRTPNLRSVDFKLFGSNWYVVTMNGHLVFFTKQSLSVLLKETKYIPKYLEAPKGSSLL